MGNSKPDHAILPRSLVGDIQSYYLIQILDFLHREGVLRSLASPTDIAVLAEERGFDLPLLRTLLEFVSLVSDIVTCIEAGSNTLYQSSYEYRNDVRPAHLLDQYVGAYGPCLANLSQIVRNPGGGAGFVDKERHAAAFSGADGGANISEVLRLIQPLRPRVVLDIGCSTANLIIELAAKDPGFNGFGLDPNAEAVGRAQSKVQSAGLAGRVQIYRGDIFEIENILTVESMGQVEIITAMSVANEFFAKEDGRSIYEFLGLLKKFFPHRILVISDYYGKLGTPRETAINYPLTLIHDIAQVVSNQGVPPTALQNWIKIYQEASCTLIKAFGGEHDGVERFIHLVQL